MSLFTVVYIIVILFVGLYGAIIYKGILLVQHGARITWGELVALLKERYGEIPSLVSLCEGYMGRDSEILKPLSQLIMNLGWVTANKDIVDGNNTLAAMLQKLFADAENYPELKTNTAFYETKHRLNELEAAISEKRESYNATLHLLNELISRLPGLVIAKIFSLKPVAPWRT